MEEFIDLCILLGCDFSKSIKGVGQVKALKYIKEHKKIEEILVQVEKDNAKKMKYVVPEEFRYVESREIFNNPMVDESVELKWSQPDEEGLLEFLC